MRAHRIIALVWLSLDGPLAGCTPSNDQKTPAPVPYAATGSPLSAGAAPKPATPQVVLTATGGRTLTVTAELALTAAEQEKGLMDRPALAKDSGMIFVFRDDGPRRFWMKNTLIPLDMIFIDRTGTVVHVEEKTRPFDLTPRGPDTPSRYVLEVDAGTAEAYGIGPGAKAVFRNIPNLAPDTPTE